AGLADGLDDAEGAADVAGDRRVSRARRPADVRAAGTRVVAEAPLIAARRRRRAVGARAERGCGADGRGAIDGGRGGGGEVTLDDRSRRGGGGRRVVVADLANGLGDLQRAADVAGDRRIRRGSGARDVGAAGAAAVAEAPLIGAPCGSGAVAAGGECGGGREGGGVGDGDCGGGGDVVVVIDCCGGGDRADV